MRLSEVLQLSVNGVVNGCFYGLMGIAFGLIYSVTERFHYAIQVSVMLAAYIALAVHDGGVPLLFAIAAGLLVAALFGPLVETAVYRPVIARNPNALMLIFVASLGLATLCENLARIVWTSNSRPFPTGFEVSPIELGSGVTLTSLELVTIVVTVAIAVGISVFLARSEQGRAMRAIRANLDLARAVGIDTRRVFTLAFALGSLVAGVGGVIFAMRFAAEPGMGHVPTFMAFVVCFVAGAGSTPVRFLVVGLLIGLFESLSNLWLRAQWNEVVVFAVLFAYVALLPLLQGRRIQWRPRRPKTAMGSV